ncbi:MAG TPA: hypothetical protein VGH29_10185 [Candidatus Binataceae bacterium]
MGRIAGQLVRVKRRLNLLAAQQMMFSTLGLLIGAGGILVIAAFFLNTAHFLTLGLLLLALLAVSVPLVTIRALRRFAAFPRTASIVDQRAELNCRLSTLLTMVQDEGKYPLWPFLVEDTLSRLDDFEPNRVEKHRISPSIYGFAAACLIASLAGLMTYSARRHQETLRKVLKSLTLEVDPSEIGPGDSPSGESAEVEGDPDTLRSLAERLDAANQGNHGGDHNTFNQLSHKARDLASSLQDRLTGRDLRDTPEKVKIRLAQALGDKPPPEENGSQGYNDSEKPPQQSTGRPNSGAGGSARRQGSKEGQEQANSKADSTSPDQSTPPPNSASGKTFDPGGPQAPGAGDSPAAGRDQGSSEEASGSSSGSGSDPEHLMGPPDAPAHKNENFEIMIDARLSDRSPIASAQPYVPPKVKTALNVYQHPDEPLDRGTVPAADRDTIKRVFER